MSASVMALFAVWLSGVTVEGFGVGFEQPRGLHRRRVQRARAELSLANCWPPRV